MRSLKNFLCPYPNTKPYPRELFFPIQINAVRDGVGMFVTVRLFALPHWWPLFRNGITGRWPAEPDWEPE